MDISAITWLKYTFRRITMEERERERERKKDFQERIVNKENIAIQIHCNSIVKNLSVGFEHSLFARFSRFAFFVAKYIYQTSFEHSVLHAVGAVKVMKSHF